MIGAPGEKKYVHLLDGGIADNLGLHAVLHDMWMEDEDGNQNDKLTSLKRIVFLVVNARSDADPRRDASGSPPGMLDMLWTSIGSSIDNRSEGLVGNIRKIMDARFKAMRRTAPETQMIFVDFDLIRDAACRAEFAHTKTNWGLKEHEIDALMAMGSAMVRASPVFQELARAAGGAVLPSDRAEAPKWPGQQRAAEACKRIQDPLAPFTLRFGNSE
jgi:NTE family protein